MFIKHEIYTLESELVLSDFGRSLNFSTGQQWSGGTL